MLIFTADVKRKRARHRVRRDTGDRIKSFAVGASVIINDGLPEVIAIPKRSTRNPGYPAVNRIHTHTQVCRPLEPAGFFGELEIQGVIQFSSLVVWRQTFSRFLQQTGAFHARPGAQTSVGTLHIAKCHEAVKGRVNPTVDWNIGRSHVLRFSGAFCGLLPKVAPGFAAQFRIVVSAIHLPAEVPTDRAANERIGGEVLLAGDAGERYGRSQAVSKELCQRPGILMGENTSRGPGNGGVFRRE